MPNIFDQFDTPSAPPAGKNPFDAFDPNPFDQFDEPAAPKIASPPGNLKLDPLQQVQMQSLSAGKGIDPENAGATLWNLLHGNDDVFLQTAAPSIVAAAHTLADNPVTRKIGFGLNFAGQAIKGDVESALFSILGHDDLANQQLLATAAKMDPQWNAEMEKRGIDTSDPYEDARATLPVAERMASGVGPGLLGSTPQLALAALQPELGAASFGFTPEGFDPVQAAAAMIAPVGGKMIGGIAERLAAEAGISDAQALEVINRLGGGAGVASIISAPTAYQITQMKSGLDRDKAIQDAASNVTLAGILGSIGVREPVPRKMDVETEARPLNIAPVENASDALPSQAPVSGKIDDLAAAVKDLQDMLRSRLPVQERNPVNAPVGGVDEVIRNVFPGEAQPIAAKVGRSANNNYRATFFAANPSLKGKVVVHHAVEQKVLTLYPGMFTKSEIHSLENLRGIPNEINADIHLTRIRQEWAQFYKANPNATRRQILQQAAKIDAKYGSHFNPPVRQKL